MHMGMWTGRRVLYLSVDAIRANPDQPRKYFEPEALRELAESIGRYGILQPLTVRRGEDGYELIAGERRLRAAKLAGLREVPCLAGRSDEEESALLSLIENLQRQDLHYMEEAQCYYDLLNNYNLTQEELAKRLGRSQSSIVIKLRLLRLSPDVVSAIREIGLSERHARAVLRLPENRRSEALITIAKRKMNARATDLYIEQLLNEAAPGRHRISMVKDVRIFVNTIDHAIRLMTDNGVPATAHREERDGYIEYTVRIPTAAAQR